MLSLPLALRDVEPNLIGGVQGEMGHRARRGDTVRAMRVAAQGQTLAQRTPPYGARYDPPYPCGQTIAERVEISI